MKKGKSMAACSDGKHTGGMKGGHPIAKQSTMAAPGLKRKVVKKGSSKKGKSKTLKRQSEGTMQWKPFGM